MCIFQKPFGSLFSPLFSVVRFSHFKALETPEFSSKLNDFMDSFTEARTLITESQDNAGTVYFSDDINDADEQTKITLTMWAELQAMLKEKNELEALEYIQKEHEVKVKQLVLELEAAKDMMEH